MLCYALRSFQTGEYRTMKKETVRIGKIDVTREIEFLRKYNLIAKEVLTQNGEQENGYGKGRTL